MPDEFWQEYRPAEVRTTTATMQSLMKRLRGSKLFYWAEQVVVVMVNGYIPTAKESKFDIGPLNTTVSGNSLEGLRLRLGGMTTVNLSRHWFARGYVAYGFRDEKFKYKGSLEYSFTPKKALDQEFPIHSLRLTHQYDVDKLAQHYLYTNQDNVFLTLKRHKDVRMQYLRTTRLEYRHEWYNHFSIALGIEHNIHEATQYVPFAYDDGTARDRYTQAGFTAKLRFAPGETFYQTHSYRIPINMDAPIITLNQTYMPKGFMGSLHEINKTELGLQKRFWFSAFGYADVIVKGEKIWSKVAYPDLLLPNVNLSYTIQPESYALMKPMEFVNDQALSWDLTYWGNGILMNSLPLIKRLRLREVISLRGIWGSRQERPRQERRHLPVPCRRPMPENGRPALYGSRRGSGQYSHHPARGLRLAPHLPRTCRDRPPRHPRPAPLQFLIPIHPPFFKRRITRINNRHPHSFSNNSHNSEQQKTTFLSGYCTLFYSVFQFVCARLGVLWDICFHIFIVVLRVKVRKRKNVDNFFCGDRKFAVILQSILFAAG